MEIISFLDNNMNEFVEEIKKIALIASPTFYEEKRRHYIESTIKKLGFENPVIDPAGNLLVRIEGKNPATIIYSAHLDTVFPIDTPLFLNESDTMLYCPGICDNATGVAALLYLMKYIKENNHPLQKSCIFLFNVCEEELGNLQGMKEFYNTFDTEKLCAHIVIEGHQIGRVSTTAVGSFRVSITVSCEGGHSWRDYGKPNAIIIAAHLISRLSAMNLPEKPKTTMNIGTIKGGTTINSIPSEAEFTLEIRCIDQIIMNQLLSDIKKMLKTGEYGGYSLKMDVLGERPCGTLRHKKLSDTIIQIIKKLNIMPILDPASTDANFPISLGLPALTIGIAEGQKTHSISESLNLKSLYPGMRQLMEIHEKLQTFI